jgi:serine/threonine protein kinase
VNSGYKRVKKLGSGGFGEVWMAERVHDKRSFAVKYLLDNDPDSVERFKREVRCLSLFVVHSGVPFRRS